VEHVREKIPKPASSPSYVCRYKHLFGTTAARERAGLQFDISAIFLLQPTGERQGNCKWGQELSFGSSNIMNYLAYQAVNLQTKDYKHLYNSKETIPGHYRWVIAHRAPLLCLTVASQSPEKGSGKASRISRLRATRREPARCC
jgi:hypothetical protein